MRWLLGLPILLLTTPALAGDPCPIGLDVAEYTPEWRDRTADLDALSSKRTWLGLNYYGESEVKVRRTVPGSPADGSGLKKGDVIATFNGVAVTGRAHLNELFDSHPNGPVTLGIRRGDETSTLTLERGPADPVFLGLVNEAETTECRRVRIVALTESQAAAVATGAFDANKGFRCQDAHVALDSSFDSGSLVMIRGGRRILLTMPGWATTCVAVAEYDGEGLTSSRLRALLERLARSYVQDRHDNP